MSKVDPVDVNDDETVGLVRIDGDVDFVATEAVAVDLLAEFVERCRSMGWDEIDIKVRRDGYFPIIAHEHRDDQGIYVAAAPVIPDDELEAMKDD